MVEAFNVFLAQKRTQLVELPQLVLMLTLHHVHWHQLLLLSQVALMAMVFTQHPMVQPNAINVQT